MTVNKIQGLDIEDSLGLDPLHDFHFCIDSGDGDENSWDPIRFRARFEKCLEERYAYSKF